MNYILLEMGRELAQQAVRTKPKCKLTQKGSVSCLAWFLVDMDPLELGKTNLPLLYAVLQMGWMLVGPHAIQHNLGQPLNAILSLDVGKKTLKQPQSQSLPV